MSNIFSPSHIERAKGKKVVAIDIDDVLANSIEEWINFVNHHKREYTPEMIAQWRSRDYVDLYELKKNVPYYYYRLLKAKYRESETKANLPTKEGAVDLTHALHILGYTIIIITKRPDFCSKMTYSWLNKNSIYYNEVIFSRDKHVVVLEKFPELKFMIEDNRDIANHVGRWNYKVFLLTNKYNRGETHRNVERVDSLLDIIKKLERGEI